MAPCLLTTRLDIKARIVAWTIQRSIIFVVPKWKSLVRTRRGEANDITLRPSPGRNALAEFDENARGIIIGICDVKRLIGLEVMHIAELV